MTPLPRADYAALARYDPGRSPVALDLSDNTNLWGTHPAALARIRVADTDDLARYPELYADTLRDAVAARFAVDPSCVTTGAGSDDVLDSAFRAAWAPGAVVRYAAPTFSMVEPLALMNGLRAEAVAWPDALEDPARLLEGRPAVVYVCRPNNPTGTSAPAEWLDHLLDAARAEPAPRPLVVLDEAYADFAPETRAPTAPEHPSLLVARTASKAYGLAGLRCGWGVSAPEVALEIEKSRGPYKVARLTAEAAAAALRDDDGWMAETVAACRDTRDRLRGELERRGIVAPPSVANFLLVPAPSGSARDDAVALRELGVAVRPFAGIPDMGEGLRVTVGPWPLMERFLGALDRVVASRAEADR
jgi:histidinol-phosphate aminotransferase